MKRALKREAEVDDALSGTRVEADACSGALVLALRSGTYAGRGRPMSDGRLDVVLGKTVGAMSSTASVDDEDGGDASVDET